MKGLACTYKVLTNHIFLLSSGLLKATYFWAHRIILVKQKGLFVCFNLAKAKLAPSVFPGCWN